MISSFYVAKIANFIIKSHIFCLFCCKYNIFLYFCKDKNN